MNTVTARSDTAGWLTTAETAARLGVRPGTIADLREAGRLGSVKVDGRRLHDPATIAAYEAVRQPQRAASGVELLEIRPAYVNERGMRVGARLPLHPLLAVIDWDACRHVSVVEVARQLDVNSGDIYRARREGLTVWKADEWALAAGRHPASVWGMDWWEVDVPDVDDELDGPEIGLSTTVDEPVSDRPWWESIVEANRLRASKRRHPSSHRPGPPFGGGTSVAA